MTEIKPYMCSCCNDIWSRDNQKSIKLGKYELHLCPDCYHEYIISNNKVLDKISDEVNKLKKVSDGNKVYVGINDVLEIIDKYKAERNKEGEHEIQDTNGNK